MPHIHKMTVFTYKNRLGKYKMPDKLLIIDDSSFSRRMIKRALPTDWSVEATESGDGLDALEKCKGIKFNYIFLDITMPEMDGIEVLQHLNEMDYTAKVYIISADIQEAIREEALALGAVAFIPKPITAEQLDKFLGKQGVL